ncbi:MAG: hypothetical protein M1816_007181 [Peltula sp. TS41687]|nr:MAG: hypothetical protein M1816_007181 [Peltula sp. TS41687]
MSSLNLPTGTPLSHATRIPTLSQLSLAPRFPAEGCGMTPVTQIESTHGTEDNDMESDSSNEQKQLDVFFRKFRDPNDMNMVVHFDQVADESCDCQLVFLNGLIPGTEFGDVSVSIFEMDEDPPRYRSPWSAAADYGSCLGTWQICGNGTIEENSAVITIRCRPHLCFLVAVEQEEVTPGIEVSDLIRTSLFMRYTCDERSNHTVTDRATTST